MADVTSSTTAAATSAATPVAAVSATVGQSIDAEIVVLKSRLASLEASAKTDWSKAVAWAKSNWAHIALTYPAAATILAPVVKDLLKAL
jgi:hypothetical protein